MSFRYTYRREEYEDDAEEEDWEFFWGKALTLIGLIDFLACLWPGFLSLFKA